MTTYNASVIIEEKYILVLNGIRNRLESGAIVKEFDTEEEAKSFYTNQLCEPYNEPGFNIYTYTHTSWFKVFKKDGPLEWFNALDKDADGTTHFTPNHYGHGLHQSIRIVEIISKTKNS